MNNIILVNTKEKTSILKLVEILPNGVLGNVHFTTEVLIGRKGVTDAKREGDGKTPIGKFEIGMAFGIHDRKNIKLDESVEYTKIKENLYWVDDINSAYYNQLVDAAKVNVDWKSAEHLSDYKIEYEFALEIKVNPENIPGKGSAIFIHCSNGKRTAGCIAISKAKMIELLSKINKNTKVHII